MHPALLSWPSVLAKRAAYQPVCQLLRAYAPVIRPNSSKLLGASQGWSLSQMRTITATAVSDAPPVTQKPPTLRTKSNYCRRGIEPCKGMWTLPAGFMELHESSAAGAARETWEEANAMVHIIAPYSHLDVPVIGQAYILFRARLKEPYTFSPGQETLETAMYDPADIPFDQLAFSSIAITLRHYVSDLAAGRFHVHHGVIDKVPGSAPNDPHSFVLRDHFAIPTAEIP